MNRILSPAEFLQIVAGVSRLPFLLLAPAVLLPVFVFSAIYSGQFDWGLAGQILLVAIAAHIAVNALNEYQDFESGLDLQTARTPFSGGSGTLPKYPYARSIALGVTIVSMLITVVVGISLVIHSDRQLILPGIAGVVLIIAYTRWINRLPLFCLFSPGLGFGLIMVNGAGKVLLDTVPPGIMALSLMATCQCSVLLLMNQFPDIEADRDAGRRHVLIRYGIQSGVSLYIGMTCLAYLILVLAVVTGSLPTAALAGLLTVPLAVSVIDQLRKSTAANHLNIDQAFISAMGKNVAVTLLTPVACGAGMLALLVISG